MEEVNIGVNDLVQDEIPPVYRETELETIDSFDANAFLNDWLPKQNRQTNELQFPSMRGVVDLIILQKYNFHKVKSLFFSKGTINELINIPNNVEILDIPYNEVTELSGLPNTLITVNVSHNRLKKVDFLTCDKIKSINVSHNHLTIVDNLPESLERLHCEYNHLQKLDLYTTKRLKELYCNNNTDKLQLTHVPDTVIHGDYTNVIVSLKKTNNTFDYIVMEDAYKEKVEKYFRMKSKYETAIQKSRRNLNETFTKTRMNNNNNKYFPLHHKIKKELKFKNDKPPCHGCGGKGGMLFQITSSQYQAFCSNEQQCDWKIIIHRGLFENREKMLYEYLEYMEGLKQRFIEGKMNSLFQYFDDKYMKTSFEKNMKLFQLYSTHLKSYLDTHNDCYYNEHKKQMILQKAKTIQEKLETVKLMLQDQDEDLLIEAVNIQMNEIRPLAQYIQRETYDIMQLEQDIESNEFVLYQYPVIASKVDTLLEGKMSVEHFGKLNREDEDEEEKEKQSDKEREREKENENKNDGLGEGFYQENEEDSIAPSVNEAESLDWGSDEILDIVDIP